MCDASFDELELDSADAAVIHVRRSDAVGARLGVGHGDIRDALDRHCVIERAILAQDTTVAVRGVFTEADVGNDEKIWEGAAEEADTCQDRAGRVVSGGTEGILCRGREGNAEEDDAAEAFSDKGGKEGDEAVEAATVLVRQGGNKCFFVGVVG